MKRLNKNHNESEEELMYLLWQAEMNKEILAFWKSIFE